MLPATRRDVRRYLVGLDQHDLGFWDVGAGVAEAETRREKGRRLFSGRDPVGVA